MFDIQGGANFASSSNIQEYSLLIPDNLVSFKNVFALALESRGIKISVEEVGDALILIVLVILVRLRFFQI